MRYVATTTMVPPTLELIDFLLSESAQDTPEQLNEQDLSAEAIVPGGRPLTIFLTWVMDRPWMTVGEGLPGN